MSIDVDVVCESEGDMRLVDRMLYSGLGGRGQVRGQLNDLEEWEKGRVGGRGKVLIEIGNYYEDGDVEDGIVEKVQRYVCKEGIVGEKGLGEGSVRGMKDIWVVSGLLEEKENEMVELKVGKVQVEQCRV